MPKGAKGSKGKKKPESLEVQVSVRVSAIVFPTREKAERARIRAMKHFLKTGESIHGVQIIGRWRNPDRATGEAWRSTEDAGQSLLEFRETLGGARGAFRRLADRYGYDLFEEEED